MTVEIAAGSGSAAQLSEIKIPQLPLREQGLTSVPAIPLDIVRMKKPQIFQWERYIEL